MANTLARLAALAALCTVTLGLAVGQKQEPTEIAWVEAKLDTALARARDRNVPIVIFACLAGETHNEEFRRHLGGNAALARILAEAVPMYASNGEPPPGASLVRHKELMDEVYNRWVAEHTPDGSWPLPEVLVVQPDGEVAARLGSGHTVSDDVIEDALATLSDKLGGGVSDAEVAQLVVLRDEGRAAQGRKDWPAAWRAWRGILNVTPAGPFAAEAQAALPTVEAEFRKLVEAAADGVDETNVAARYATLRDVARRARGTPLEQLARKLVATLERDKRFKKLLPALRLEEEAEDLLYEAERLIARGDDAEALKLLKKVTGKKYAATMASARALRAHAERLQ